MLPPLKRREINSRKKEVVAYDLETTRIKAGTPTPLYVTAYSENFTLSVRVTGKNPLQSLCNILETHLLIKERNGTRFVAWYGNQFDVYIIAKALLLSDRWIMKPYLTSSKNLRGLGRAKLLPLLRCLDARYDGRVDATAIETISPHLFKNSSIDSSS